MILFTWPLFLSNTSEEESVIIWGHRGITIRNQITIIPLKLTIRDFFGVFILDCCVWSLCKGTKLLALMMWQLNLIKHAKNCCIYVSIFYLSMHTHKHTHTKLCIFPNTILGIVETKMAFVFENLTGHLEDKIFFCE